MLYTKRMIPEAVSRGDGDSGELMDNQIANKCRYRKSDFRCRQIGSIDNEDIERHRIRASRLLNIARTSYDDCLALITKGVP